MKRYEVVADLQGGEFGMGRQYTAEGWVEQACDWLDADGYDDIEGAKARWLLEIAEGRPQNVLDEIADIWQLEIQEVKEK